MKTKIQVLAMMFIAAMAFGACDDDDKNDNIKAPDAVSKALKDKYPAAMDIEWERKGDYFVADCWRTAGKWMCGMMFRQPGN